MPTIGERVTGVITHVEFDRGICSGYSQLCESGAVDAIAEEIETYIQNGGYSVHKVCDGDIVLALFDTDGVWYRARILSKDGDTITVFFIDYGNTETVSFDNIRQLPKSLVNLQSLAKLCNFVEINASENSWTNNEKEKVEEMLVNEEFEFEIISPGGGGALNVKIYNSHGNVQFGNVHEPKMTTPRSIIRYQPLTRGSAVKAYLSYVDSANKFWIQLQNQENNLTNLMDDISNFVASGQGVEVLPCPVVGELCLATYSEDGVPYRSQILTSNSGKCLVQFVDYGNSESLSVNDLMTIPDRFKLLPIQGIKCCYKRTKLNPNILEDKLQTLTGKEDGVSVQVIDKAGDVYTVELEEIENELNAAQNSTSVEFKHIFSNFGLAVNSVNDIGLSYVCHPGKFFIQLLKDSSKIEELSDKIAVEYITSKTLSDVNKGSPCLAKMSDEDIYRCVVSNVSGSLATVYAVDFGFEEDVDKSSLKVLSKENMSEPAYCVECTVDVTKLDKENWSQEEINLLKEFESEIPLVSKVTSQRGNIYQLDLYDTRDIDIDRYINAELLGTNKMAKSHPTQSAPREVKPVNVPPPSITIGTAELLCITSVKSPSLFYAQLTKIPVQEVAELQETLSVIYEKPQEGISRDSIGTFCASKYVDGGWYRGVILSSSGGTAEVGFIDFGDSVSQTVSALKYLKPEIAIMPQMCIICKLSQVPRNLRREDMESLILNKALELKILSKTDDVYPTYMVEFTSHPNNTAVVNKLQESTTRKLPRLPNMLQHSPSGPDGAKSYEGRAGQINSFPSMSVGVGSTEEVMVTHIAHPEMFHCQLSKTATDLDKMMNEINTYYPKLREEEEILENCSLGEACAAKYTEDEMWYRAKVSGLLAKGAVEVLFVDYGNTECMSRETLKKLKPEFLSLPIQAVSCSLTGISSKQGYWSSEDTLNFEEMALDQTFKATFNLYNSNQEMYSVALRNDKGVDVNKAFGASTVTQASERDSGWDDGPSSSRLNARNNQGSSGFGRNRGSSGFDGGRRENNFNGGFKNDRNRDSGFGEKRESGFGGNRGDGSGFGGGNRGGGGFGGDRASSGFGGNKFSSRNSYQANSNDVSEDWGDGAVSRDNKSGSGGFGGGNRSGFGGNRSEGNSNGFGGRSSGFGRDKSEGGNTGFGGSNSGFSGRSSGFGGSKGFGSSDSGSFGNKSGFGNRTYHKYGQEGHLARDYPNQERRGGGGGRACHKCGEEGHFARECSNPGSGRQGGGGGRACHKCGEEGHFARECPNPGSGGGRPGFGSGRGGFGGKSSGFGSSGGFSGASGGFGGSSNGAGGDDDWGDNTKSSGGGFGGNRPSGIFGSRSNGGGGDGFQKRNVGSDWGSDDRKSGFGSGSRPGFSGDNKPHQGFGGGFKGGKLSGGGFGGGGSAPSTDDWELEDTGPSLPVSESLSVDTEWHHDNADLFSLTKLNIGETYAVYMVVPNTPTEFWVQVTKFTEELETVMEKIQEVYSSAASDNLPIKKPEIGMPCIAMFSEDKRWYRGEIQGFGQQDDLEVHFVDYGNSESVSKSNVKAVKKEFMKLSSQGVKCSLQGLKPTNGMWSDKAIEEFEHLTMDKVLSLHIKSYAAGTYLVDISERDSKESISQNLMDMGFCSLEMLDSPIKSFSVSNPYPSMDITENSEFQGFLSAIENPQDFWIQPADAEEELELFSSKIQEEYSTEKSVPSVVDIGSPVVALFAEDGAWYRAYIESKKGDKFTVRYVDYGNADTVSIENLREPTDDLLKTPCKALHCSLEGIRPLQSVWSVDARDIMEGVIKDGMLVKLKKKGNICLTELEVDGNSVVDELVKAAVVRRDTVKVPNRGRESLQYKETAKLDIGVSETVFISHVNSFNSFFCQKTSTSGELDMLMVKIEDYCQSGSSFTTDLELDMPCLAKYSADDSWYRGSVKCVYPDGALVQFVDYGNEERVDKSGLNMITEDLVDLPPQAIQTCLELQGTQPCFNKFQEMIPDQEFHAVALEDMSGKIKVSLMNKEGQSVLELLKMDQIKPVSSLEFVNSLPRQEVPSQEINMFVSVVESPSKFYLQKAGFEEELEQISSKLEATYSSLKSPPTVLNEGIVCCSKYSEDEKWYRAKVLSLSGDKVQVLFVDYGNEEEVDIGSLRALTSEFGSPPFAFECQLAGVVPVDDKWSAEATTFFEEQVMEKELHCKFESLSEVTLKCEEKCLNDVMIETGYGIKESDIEMKFKEQKMPVGEIRALVSHLEGEVFFLQLVEEESILGVLSEVLQEKCASSPGCDTIDIGLQCCAKFSVDGYWYRAEVEEIMSEDVSVRFIDFGNNDTVTKKELRILNKDLLSAPLAYKCCLADLGKLSGVQMQHLRTLLEEQEVLVEFTGKEGDTYLTTLKKTDGRNIKEVLAVGSSSSDEQKYEGDEKCSLSDSLKELDIRDDAASKSLVNDTHLTLDVTGFSDTLDTSKQEHNDTVEEEYIEKVEDLIPMKLEQGARLHVSISHLTSPSSFYIHLDEKKGEVDLLLDEIFELYSNSNQESHRIDALLENDVVVAKFAEDSSWYRAKILDVLNENECKVKFIDYGNDEICKKSDLRKMLKSFGKSPIQTVECTLSGVRAKDGPWSEEALNLFTEMTEEKSLLADVIQIGEDGNCMLQLMNMGISVGQALIDKGYAVSSTTPIAVSQRTRRVFSDSSDVACTPIVKKLIEEFQEIGEENFIGKFQRVCLEKDTEYAVNISHFESPSMFWCQLSNSAEDLENMMDQIQEKYKDMSSYTVVDFSVGTSCIVLDTFDGLFYRAVIVLNEDKDSESVHVFFVDHGNTDIASKSNLRAISEEFLTLPAQCFPCKLSMLTPSTSDQWTKEACKYFESLTIDKADLTVYVDHLHSSVASVQLLDGEMSVAQAMLEEDLAEMITDSMIEGSQIDDSLMNISKVTDDLEASRMFDTSIYEGTTVDSIFSHYKQEELDIDSEYLGDVTEIVNPSLFFLHLMQKEENLQNLQTQIDMHISNKEGEVNQHILEIGAACLAKLSTEKWGRATILDIGEDEVEVAFVDFGSKCSVKKSELRRLPEALLEVPALAVPCGLTDLESPDGQAWSEDVVEFLKDNMVGKLLIYVRHKTADGVHLVVASRQEMQDGEELNKLLVELGLARVQLNTTLFDMMKSTSDQEQSFHELSMHRMNSFGSEEFGDPSTEQSRQVGDHSVLDTTSSSVCHCDSSLDATDTSINQSETELESTCPYMETTDTSLNESEATDRSINHSFVDTTDSSINETTDTSINESTDMSMYDETSKSSCTENSVIDISVNRSTLDVIDSSVDDSKYETTNSCPVESSMNTTNDTSFLDTTGIEESVLETTNASDSFHYVNYKHDDTGPKDEDEFFDAEDNDEIKKSDINSSDVSLSNVEGAAKECEDDGKVQEIAQGSEEDKNRGELSTKLEDTESSKDEPCQYQPTESLAESLKPDVNGKRLNLGNEPEKEIENDEIFRKQAGEIVAKMLEGLVVSVTETNNADN